MNTSLTTVFMDCRDKPTAVRFNFGDVD